jgi:DNA-nicking Smr family endonuclease
MSRDQKSRGPVAIPQPVDNDARLFREAMSGAQPIKVAPRVIHNPRPAPVPVQSLLDGHAALEESRSGPLSPEQAMETGEELVYLRPGLPINVLRQLRRGKWVVQDALDLHGLNQVQARALLGEFLSECIRRHLRCVRVIHGKGLRSPQRQPVLKGKLERWLAHRDEILAYCQAPANQGGSGALLVLLSA